MVGCCLFVDMTKKKSWVDKMLEDPEIKREYEKALYIEETIDLLDFGTVQKTKKGRVVKTKKWKDIRRRSLDLDKQYAKYARKWVEESTMTLSEVKDAIKAVKTILAKVWLTNDESYYFKVSKKEALDMLKFNTYNINVPDRIQAYWHKRKETIYIG